MSATANWMSAFPGFTRLESDVAGKLAAAGKLVHLPAQTRIFGAGQAAGAYLLLVSGTVRVQQVSDGGREIVLYRVNAGESCALTTACLLGHEDYEAEGIAETDVEAVAVPRATFDELLARSPQFRQFVFTSFSTRLTDLFRLIEDVAFSRVDVRLAERLLTLADGRKHVEMTHQQLAAELGTAREVISRQLHEFQRRGWITTGRGTIEIHKPEALRHLAASP